MYIHIPSFFKPIGCGRSQKRSRRVEEAIGGVAYSNDRRRRRMEMSWARGERGITHVVRIRPPRTVIARAAVGRLSLRIRLGK